MGSIGICTFNEMLRLTAILLSSLILLQNFHLGISDLVRLDELLEHARYHQEQYGDSFATFLAKHYGDQKKDHDREHQEHEQLPFQHFPQQFLGNTHYFLAQRFVWSGLPENQESQTHLFYYHLRSPGEFEDGVFQPPRRS